MDLSTDFGKEIPSRNLRKKGQSRSCNVCVCDGNWVVCVSGQKCRHHSCFCCDKGTATQHPKSRGPKNAAFGKACLCPLPERGVFTKTAKMTNFRSNPVKQGLCCSDPVKMTKMTKMADVTQPKAWFTKGMLSCSLTERSVVVVLGAPNLSLAQKSSTRGLIGILQDMQDITTLDPPLDLDGRNSLDRRRRKWQEDIERELLFYERPGIAACLVLVHERSFRKTQEGLVGCVRGVPEQNSGKIPGKFWENVSF